MRHRLRSLAPLCALILSLGLSQDADARSPKPKPQIKLEPRTAQNLQLMVPKGWNVTSSAQPITTVQVEHTKGSKSQPSVLINAFPLQYGPTTAQQYAARLRTAIASPTLVARQPGPYGSVIETYDGVVNGLKARVAILHWADTSRNYGMTTLFAAQPADFKRLGGVKFMLRVMRIDKAPVTTKAAPKVAARPATPTTLNIPAKYRASSSPTLFYVADNLPELSPAQIAAAFRQFNATERLSLGVYQAFANFLHGMACSADRSVLLVTNSSRQNCQQTMAGWQQTLQLTQGNKAKAFEYALRERLTYLNGARCGSGQTDRATCNAYLQTKQRMMNQNHNFMRKMIIRMGGGCVVGEDAGCVH